MAEFNSPNVDTGLGSFADEKEYEMRVKRGVMISIQKEPRIVFRVIVVQRLAGAEAQISASVFGTSEDVP